MAKRLVKNKNLTSRGFFFLFIIAVEFLMSFTFLGHVHTPSGTLTYAFIPVIVGGCFLSVGQTTLVGLACGLASSYEASVSYTSMVDRVFSMSASGYLGGSFVVSVVTHVLFGFLVGVMFAMARRSVHVRGWAGVAAIVAPKLHSLLMGVSIGAFFPSLGYGVPQALAFGAKDVVIALFCFAIVELCLVAAQSDLAVRMEEAIDQTALLPSPEGSMVPFYALVGVFMLLVSVASTFYFTERMVHTLDVHGLVVTVMAERDLLHLQMQFFFASMSLNFILLLVLVLLQKFHLHARHADQMDPLTGAMGRRLFTGYCDRLQSSGDMRGKECWFLFLDLDYFKRINDMFGHLAGDDVLRDFAAAISRVFAGCAQIGRMGGDEFAIMTCRTLPVDVLREKLDALYREVADIFPSAGKITCSVGACRFKCPRDLKVVYAEADRALYVAKKQGRADYVIVELGEGGLKTPLMEPIEAQVSEDDDWPAAVLEMNR